MGRIHRSSKEAKELGAECDKEIHLLKNILRSFSPDLSFQNLTENKLLALRDWFVEYRTEDKTENYNINTAIRLLISTLNF